jgi:hypothetical protein
VVVPHKETTMRNNRMHLLQSGVPFNVIALWLGHESPTTTHRYVEANLAMKEKSLARLAASDITIRRFKAPDSLMRFLQTLNYVHQRRAQHPPVLRFQKPLNIV